MGRAVGGRAAALLLAGRTVSRFGSSFYLVALPLYVLERTGSLGASGLFFTLTSLPPLLAETMAGVDNFKLVLQDVLKVDLRALIEEEFPGMPVAVCANLPYYITSPIVMKLLGDRLPIQNLTVMVQKEAADRLAAAPGTRASSAISCAVSYYATSKLMFTAAPGSFYPAPKVTSAVVRMDIRTTPAVQVEDEDGYFALIRAAFGQRRKTAANAIASGLGLPKDKVIAAIEAAGFDARIRPEALTLEDFAAVQRELK